MSRGVLALVAAEVKDVAAFPLLHRRDYPWSRLPFLPAA